MANVTKAWLVLFCVLLVSELSFHQCAEISQSEMMHDNSNEINYHKLPQIFCLPSLCGGLFCWCCPGKPLCNKDKYLCDVLCSAKS
ncbi:hypothetical protein DCAR_0933559 [Daucus carota subsp. sativus]|uniref:Embryo surrounding factor 1 brassicaceae domain-containing protein n=1 Tax=Daucus carota subsp. sativus TaxID=79200 RepID=A0AAF0XTJ6_DAUCS|nr:hypothetical protein DCAR_0933559 [Daucus carota subsp. sativus]